MRIRWRGLELPARVIRDESISTSKFGRFIIEPFERGFGTTIGNSLRRILLSSLEGSAVTHARIAGADHEFCSLPGVLEDVDAEAPRTLRIDRNKKGAIRAGDFECDNNVTVQNPDLHIATLTDDVRFSVELTARRGRGYVPASENTEEEAELGTIAVDSLFSPVTRVRYRTEDTRVGQKTNYDRLILEVWTKGTVRPEDALVEAAKVLRKHLNPFVQYTELGAQVRSPARGMSTMVDAAMESKLNMTLSELMLSVRASNCLESENIMTVRDLVRRSEDQLLEVRNFGETTLTEVKDKLRELGLHLGMRVPPAPVGVA